MLRKDPLSSTLLVNGNGQIYIGTNHWVPPGTLLLLVIHDNKSQVAGGTQWRQYALFNTLNLAID